jgi:hypothetical protein
MNRSGPTVPVVPVSEKPYLAATGALTATPHRDEIASSRRTVAGPGTLTRTGRPICRALTSVSHASTWAASNPNCVITSPPSPRRLSSAVFTARAAQSAPPVTTGWPPG